MAKMVAAGKFPNRNEEEEMRRNMNTPELSVIGRLSGVDLDYGHFARAEESKHRARVAADPSSEITSGAIRDAAIRGLAAHKLLGLGRNKNDFLFGNDEAK